MRRLRLVTAAACLAGLSALAPAIASSQTAAPATLRWYKGNTHTHTLNSDGDSTPAALKTSGGLNSA